MKTDKWSLLLLLLFLNFNYMLSAQTAVIDDSDGNFAILAAQVTVTSPNGGECWNGGETQNITWTADATIASVNIDYSSNGGNSWIQVASGVANSGTFAWTVPADPSLNCLVRISAVGDAGNNDVSNDEFFISPSLLESITAPEAPSGPVSGAVNSAFSFSTGGAISSLQHELQYRFDWGDGSYSDWLETGTTSTAHAWTSGGYYPVRTMARCVVHTGVESAWSEPLYVSISDGSSPLALWNTFAGGSALDTCNAAVTDASGNIYIAGKSSGSWGVPVSPFTGSEDAFVAKLSSDGVQLWHTYLGGTGNDAAIGIAIDGNGDVLVTGNSNITWGSPLAPYVYLGSNTNGFAAKLDANGNRLWHTFFGEYGWDYGVAIETDPGNSIFIAGHSSVDWGDPIVYHDSEVNNDGFVIKLSSNGYRQWNTFFGGGGADRVTGISITASGALIVSGYSSATWGTPLNPFSGGDNDAFVVSLDSSGTRQWSTFLGGSDNDMAKAVDGDGNGNIFVAGNSASAWGAPLSPYNGGDDGFLAMLDSGGIVQWNTFIGGNGADSVNSIITDSSGILYVAGTSDANWGTPLSPYNGGTDGFISRLGMNGTPQWSAFIGGGGADSGADIVAGGYGSIIVAGDSDSSWGSPINPFSGANDAFITKYGSNANVMSVLSPNGGESWEVGSVHDINWSLDGSVSSVKIDYSADGGATWIQVTADTMNDGVYAWTVPDATSSTCLVRVSDSDGDPSDVSDSSFSIIASTSEAVSSPSTPSGPAIKAVLSDGHYSTGGAVSTWSDPVQYLIDWGDGSDSGWLDVGVAESDHSWPAGGNYQVRAKARCATHVNVESPWSGSLTVQVSENSPQVQWNTFLGSSAADNGYAAVSDAEGNTFVTGSSAKTWGTPVTSYAGLDDAFVAKLNSAGQLQWLTFLGCSNTDIGYAIAIDHEGKIIVAGSSKGTWGTPRDGFWGLNGYTDAFVAKLNANGTRAWNTFLGGPGNDVGIALAVDAGNNVLLGGYCSESWGTPVNPFSGTSNLEGFLAKLNANGDLQWNTFFGGNSGEDRVAGIALDHGGNAYVAGFSAASWGTPLTPFSGGAFDGFVAKFNYDGVRWWHSFHGGSGSDKPKAITVNDAGHVYLTGTSDSSWGTPIRSYSGGNDAFLVQFNADGVFQWSTFMGGSGGDNGNAVAADSGGGILVAGTSNATWGDPVHAYSAGSDAFLARFDGDGNALWNTFLGGSGADIGYGVSLDSGGGRIIVGRSDASWGSPLRAYSGNTDAFVTRVFFSADELTVTSPNGGESWVATSSHDISWTSSSMGTPIDIHCSTDGGSTWTPVAGSTANDGLFSWTIPDTPSTSCLIRVQETDGSPTDTSDSAFTIQAYSAETVSTPFAPAGTSEGSVYTGYSFSADGSLSNWSDPVQYLFDWGDGGDSGWLAAGTTSAAHSWSAPGSYQVRVKARCAVHTAIESIWSDVHPLTITQAGGLTVAWNTFLGNATIDEGNAIVRDGNGNTYITGKSASAWGSPVNAFAGAEDAFVAKISADGALQWHTFLGGSGNDVGTEIALDGNGNILITGTSYASWGSPIRAFTYYYGNPDGFAAKLDANGNKLWHTFLGGSYWDYGMAIAVDGNNNVFVSGNAQSSWGSPIVKHSGVGSQSDGYLVKLNGSGVMQWITFFGSSASADRVSAIVMDGTGNVFISGYCPATWGTPLNPHAGGDYDACVVKINSSGARQWHTFIGGTGNDQGKDVALDSAGNVYVTGSSDIGWGAPVNPCASGGDGFLAKLNSSGGAQWHTFMGGSGAESGNGLIIDDSDCAVVAGASDAAWGNPIQAYQGGNDGFLARFNGSGELNWNTFLGGGGADSLSDIARDGSGSISASGKSDVTWGNPIRAHSGNFDAFAVKVNL